jgi:hypothetical protein
MNTTTSLLLNGFLGIVLIVALGSVVRLAHRLRPSRPETLHPSQPIPLHLALEANEARDLARAA